MLVCCKAVASFSTMWRRWWAQWFLTAPSLLAFALQVDWTLNIGEQALDICIVSFNQSASSVFVLGERNFFCLKDNGQIRFMKKLDCSPSCFLPYCSGECEDSCYPFWLCLIHTCTHQRTPHSDTHFKRLGKRLSLSLSHPLFCRRLL